MSEIIPVFSRKPIFGYPVMVGATVCIAFVSMSVWAHHMFTIGMNSYANSFFTLTTMAVGVPTGIKIFNCIGVLNWVLPTHIVPIQVKILISVGTPTGIVLKE